MTHLAANGGGLKKGRSAETGGDAFQILIGILTLTVLALTAYQFFH